MTMETIKRNNAILQNYNDGLSVRELESKFKLSRQRIYYILQSLRYVPHNQSVNFLSIAKLKAKRQELMDEVEQLDLTLKALERFETKHKILTKIKNMSIEEIAENFTSAYELLLDLTCCYPKEDTLIILESEATDE